MASATPADLHAVLITGVFGSGKTSIAEEIADVLEGAGLPYALLDLDYLMWFYTGPAGPRACGISSWRGPFWTAESWIASRLRFACRSRSFD
jgi:chloramphenicol 3-O-phosphotransferase